MSVATLVTDLRRRDVRLALDGDALELDAPTGVLTAEDLAVLRRRKALIVSFLLWEQRGRAPHVLSAAWPTPGAWQHEYATTGRHPLACPACGARTLRRQPDGSVGCPTCAPQGLA